jgi:hypothetical protein
VSGHNRQVDETRTGAVYAALGDSMSIDDYAGGAGRGAASLLWRNRDDDFPAWVGRDLTARGRFLGHGLAAGDPTQPAARPPNRDLWYCGLIEPNAWGASEIRAAFWETLAFRRSARLGG